MDEIKSNSYKSKNNEKEEKRVQRVVSTKVTTKKKNSFSKFIDEFISDDIYSLKSYIVDDVIMPALKKTIFDIFTNGVDIILYGNSSSRRSSGRAPIEKYSYAGYYGRNDSRSAPSKYSKPNYSYDEIILETRGDAEAVLSEMDNIIKRYGQATVADLYDAVGITGNYTDNSYGWTDLRYASVEHNRNGYLLKLPKPMPID